MKTYAYGFPRIGKKREYKKIIESYWSGKISEDELNDGIDKLQEDIVSLYETYVDGFPIGEMTFYDNMLDTAIMLGLYENKNMEDYYELCRGKKALPMTKWFNTNYHYLVPEINDKMFLNWNKPCEYLKRYKKGIPYIIGPFTFLKLSGNPNMEYLKYLGEIYREIIKDFKEIHIDEPAFVMDLTGEEIEFLMEVYHSMIPIGLSVNLFTYYESVDFLKELYELPVKSIGLDFVNGKDNFEHLRKLGFPHDKTLIAGIVNGRNIWKTDIDKASEQFRELSGYAKHIIISNGAPLYHLPVSVKCEKFENNLEYKMAFAEERLYELRLISGNLNGEEIEKRQNAVDIGFNKDVRERVANLKPHDFIRNISYEERVGLQKKKFNFPLFPTTTIGSFPQTIDVRKKRSDYKSGRISSMEYKNFIKEKIKHVINIQEELGFDVLVHGEFERTDMVEFFAEKLDGMATTKNGWIISYGTRAYRPPIIYGDISRPCPMTIDEISYGQSLTGKPVKGMLTGPVTIISWSFVREDLPLSQVAFQIGLCLQDEIRDCEKSGIKIIQVDEPAFKEKCPLKKKYRDEYFQWAVKSFNLSVNSEGDTQINTHMCYSDFGEIMNEISNMDFDVILIEATRSKGNIIESFEKADFKKQIGLGVWDIHSPEEPQMNYMKNILKRGLRFIERENLWITPDCGLKTRGWEETINSLKKIILLAKELRWEDR